MKRTRIWNLLQIKYPILQGGMYWLTNAELAAAVSSSAALGIISLLAGMEAQGHSSENLRLQITKARELKKSHSVSTFLSTYEKPAFSSIFSSDTRLEFLLRPQEVRPIILNFFVKEVATVGHHIGRYWTLRGV